MLSCHVDVYINYTNNNSERGEREREKGVEREKERNRERWEEEGREIERKGWREKKLETERGGRKWGER